MRILPLQSGSNGNCIYVEANGTGVLFDGGLSVKQARERLALYSIDLASISALFISHEHSDHVCHAGALARAGRFPIYITPRTFRVAQRRFDLKSNVNLVHFQAGLSVRVGSLTIASLPTPHDAVDGVVFVADDGLHRLGVCTDFGHVYAELRDLVAGVDGLYLESNYDHHSLMNGPYPTSLKTRISGARGHISNSDAAHLLAEAASDRLQWVYLAHLSAKNNSPALALQTHRQVLGDGLPLIVAKRFCVTPPQTLAADMFQTTRQKAVLDHALSSFWQQGERLASTDALRRPIRQRPVDTAGGFRF